MQGRCFPYAQQLYRDNQIEFTVTMIHTGLNKFRLLLSVFVAMAALFAPVCIHAQESGGGKPLAAQVKEWQALLDRYEKILAKGDADDDRLVEIRAELAALRLEARSAADLARPLVQSARDELAALGPPPPKGSHRKRRDLPPNARPSANAWRTWKAA
ncbi:hypothetical protein [Methylococcus sp. BF19-07]|uniref:hypothetical protein n=1 Tax=Methylococcus sp. BF19-07 TaxID=2743472 RepID=UPI001E60E30C|nr:hypothetical protein [Methylococcus sp. BF19-07]